MQPRITVLTLGVDDLERSLEFYRDGLGFKTEGVIGQQFEHGAVVFFDMQPGLRLAIWPRASLFHDNELSFAPFAPGHVSIGHNVDSDAEVDAVMDLARRAGATVVKGPGKTFYGGFAGYFQDPAGPLWEVVHLPD